MICEEILALSNIEKERKLLLAPESAAVVEGKNGDRKERPGSTEKAKTIPSEGLFGRRGFKSQLVEEHTYASWVEKQYKEQRGHEIITEKCEN